MIFTIAPDMLAQQYPIFPMDPKTGLPRGANKEAFAMNSTERVCVPDSHANTTTSVTGVINHSQRISVPLSTQHKMRLKSKPQNEVTNLQDQNVTEVIPLPTPVAVHNLEEALSGHPDKNFVSELCNLFTHGVHIGFQGQRAPRFSKKLPTAFANPAIVSSNLATEVSLGRMAGPFDSPPFQPNSVRFFICLI